MGKMETEGGAEPASGAGTKAGGAPRRALAPPLLGEGALREREGKELGRWRGAPKPCQSHAGEASGHSWSWASLRSASQAGPPDAPGRLFGSPPSPSARPAVGDARPPRPARPWGGTAGPSAARRRWLPSWRLSGSARWSRGDAAGLRTQRRALARLVRPLPQPLAIPALYRLASRRVRPCGLTPPFSQQDRFGGGGPGRVGAGASVGSLDQQWGWGPGHLKIGATQGTRLHPGAISQSPRESFWGWVGHRV